MKTLGKEKTPNIFFPDFEIEKFEFLPKGKNFSLIYRPEDYSFDIEPLDGTRDTSIMINDLQLEIDHEGKIMYVWGLCPLIKHEETAQFPTKYKSGSLV